MLEPACRDVTILNVGAFEAWLTKTVMGGRVDVVITRRSPGHGVRANQNRGAAVCRSDRAPPSSSCTTRRSSARAPFWVPVGGNQSSTGRGAVMGWKPERPRFRPGSRATHVRQPSSVHTRVSPLPSPARVLGHVGKHAETQPGSWRMGRAAPRGPSRPPSPPPAPHRSCAPARMPSLFNRHLRTFFGAYG